MPKKQKRRPKKTTTRADAIEAFWKWWRTVEKRVAKSFSRGGLSAPMVRALGKRVASIDARLDWEFGAGRASAHHLCLSGVGDPEVRVIAERWVRRAPRGGKTWEFYAARQAADGDGLVLSMDGHDVAIDEMMIASVEDDARERMRVVVHHPAFAKTKKDLRRRMAFIALNTALGEDDFERFVDDFDVAPKKAADGAVPLVQFKKSFAAFAARATGEQWAVLEAKTKSGARMVATANRALKRIDHPLLDMHVAITIELNTPNDEGLTTREEGAELRAAEDALLAALGEHAANLGHETFRGERIVHLHVMEGGPAALIIERWVARNAAHTIGVTVERDPHWRTLDRFG